MRGDNDAAICRMGFHPVHPHMRGDNATMQQKAGLFLGSPPHAWGQLDTTHTEEDSARFTPTCVGTTSSGALSSTTMEVHPHMRGDNSKRVRRSPMSSRFTPTCVGTTGQSGQFHRLRSVHPHMRGDNRLTDHNFNAIIGSPPHAWGQQTVMPEILLKVRFTPTCVGTTTKAAPQRSQGQVHPHMRGDNAAKQT